MTAPLIPRKLTLCDLQQAADQMGISRQVASKHERKALRKIRKAIEADSELMELATIVLEKE